MKDFTAHVRFDNGQMVVQPVKVHLQNVAKYAALNASKIDLSSVGEVLGLLHDLGKYSQAFQHYIGSAAGIIEQDEDEYVEAGKLKGKIDHSTAGAKHIWNSVEEEDKLQIAAQVMSLCIASHHSGLIDCISIDGENTFEKRMKKPENKVFYSEIINSGIDSELFERINKLISDKAVFSDIINFLKKIAKTENSERSIKSLFQYGLLVRMLFSCLIDADRTDTANFEKPQSGSLRTDGKYNGWEKLISRLERKLALFELKTDRQPIDNIRKKIADYCLIKAEDKQGVFTLTVPTGGGKTLSSLRFALHHAKIHKLDRIVYVVPYTSIIDQNAGIVREILESDENESGRIVLEHHSNLFPEKLTWKTKILAENWDVPIVFTTSVQFLETLFGGGTRSVRRMHQLARSIIIFDEIQTLPVKTTHMFCNAVNFLVNHCKTSIVLCTATQPLLNKVAEEKGKINFSVSNEIIPDVEDLFKELKRVTIFNKTKPEGWEIDEVAHLALEQIKEVLSCLIIVNTKRNAQAVFAACQNKSDIPVFHLSTDLCPSHRTDVFNRIRNLLDNNQPVICISTQLIEAGVDIDFGTVIRFIAGLDSIAQAAGRCNRHGKRHLGSVFVINPREENIDSMHDIKLGRDVSVRIINEVENLSAGLQKDLLHPDVMERYFQYYFYSRAGEMSYPIDIGHNDSLLNLLSLNSSSVNEFVRINDKRPGIFFNQAFQTAGHNFKAIEDFTRGIVIPYSDEGKGVVADLFSQYATERRFDILRRAQRFSVNAFPNTIKKLLEQKALREVPDIGVLVLDDPRYYDLEYGLSTELRNSYETLIK